MAIEKLASSDMVGYDSTISFPRGTTRSERERGERPIAPPCASKPFAFDSARANGIAEGRGLFLFQNALVEVGIVVAVVYVGVAVCIYLGVIHIYDSVEIRVERAVPEIRWGVSATDFAGGTGAGVHNG